MLRGVTFTSVLPWIRVQVVSDASQSPIFILFSLSEATGCLIRVENDRALLLEIGFK